MKEDKLYLLHIKECIDRIETYVAEANQKGFMDSSMLQDAVLRNLQTLAESTQRLSDSLKAAYSNVEWYKISGFCNVLAHDYLGVDMERIWKIIEKDLPNLKLAISIMLQKL